MKTNHLLFAMTFLQNTIYLLFAIVFLQILIIPSFGDDSKHTNRACVCNGDFTKDCCGDTNGFFDENNPDRKCVYNDEHPGTGDQNDFKNCCHEKNKVLRGFDCWDDHPDS